MSEYLTKIKRCRILQIKTIIKRISLISRRPWLDEPTASTARGDDDDTNSSDQTQFITKFVCIYILLPFFLGKEKKRETKLCDTTLDKNASSGGERCNRWRICTIVCLCVCVCFRVCFTAGHFLRKGEKR